MAAYTEKLMLETFDAMLREMPFDKITVSALVKRCGISPNTFYYHYQDIYALLDDWINKVMGRFIPQALDENDDALYTHWKDGVKGFLLECQSRSVQVGHLLSSLSRGRIERFLFSQPDDWTYLLLRHAAIGKDVREDQLQDLSDFLRYAFVGFFLRFVWNHMQGDVDTAVDRLAVLFEGFVHSSIDTYARQQKP